MVGTFAAPRSPPPFQTRAPCARIWAATRLGCVIPLHICKRPLSPSTSLVRIECKRAAPALEIARIPPIYRAHSPYQRVFCGGGIRGRI
jgi:hypothetical protein